ncbi:cytochrome P450 [Coprinopsis sp. MPI-PUGE-AT-0042]|nr:cytochrome P450 [Coprinopsis sp. MPI-PUGE-AT-0042]
MELSIPSSLQGVWRTDISWVLLLVLLRAVLKGRSKVKTTNARTQEPSWLFGMFPTMLKNNSPGALTEGWARDYGKVFRLPMPFGSQSIVICDVKAAIHFFSRDTFTYQQTKLSANFIKNMFGKGILWAEEEDHKRQRKALTPAFSNAALRGYLSVFYDSGGNPTIEVQGWMNCVALDNLGIAGFGHNFGALDGKKPEVVKVFEAFESPAQANFVARMFLLELPTSTNRMLKGIKRSMKVIADDLMGRMKQEMSMVQDKHTEKSIIGLLIKAESSSTELAMSREEVEAQATLLFAGYETTSETLRLHPPLGAIGRRHDDVIPLGEPIVTASGETVSELVIAKGTGVQCSVFQLNLSEELWGPDSREFKPERWLDDQLLPGAKTIQGYHHILTFADGPRFCLGRNFALSNFKATLSVMIRNFAFELPQGPETAIGRHRGVLPRPKIEGEEGPRVPLKVRKLE